MEDRKDTISRKSAIDALNEYFARIGKLKGRGLTKGEKAISLDTVGTIKTLPPAQQWIPCSERLPEHPENDDYYLVTIQCEHYDGWDDYVTGFAEWTKHGWDELSCYIGQIKVVAWMPLPEPWKGEE